MAGPLYYTNFQNFTVGELGGQHGWLATEASASQGVLSGVVSGLGKLGYVGFNAPQEEFVAVWRDINYDPVAEGFPLIDFSALIGIADSTGVNPPRDNFFIAFYNTDLEVLAAVNFDNTVTGFGIWRYDGISYHPTSTTFVNDEVHELMIEVDYEANIWSAWLDLLPIFENVAFTERTVPKNLGTIAAEWLLTESANPGDNWMLFDEWTISANQHPAPLELSHFGLSVETGLRLEWEARPLTAYRVEYSHDLETWEDDLPNSLLTSGDCWETLKFTEPNAPAGAIERYYRVREVLPGSGS